MSRTSRQSHPRIRRWAKLAQRRIVAAPRWTQIGGALALGCIAIVAINLTYQVIRKPTELLFFLGNSFSKQPHETWRQYGPLFRTYATRTISAELLAALAQIESSGNPVDRTYWRWRLNYNPFKIYQPASTAVGLFQTTDPAYSEVARYCIRENAVADAGCGLVPYIRVIPSHAVELASIYLDRNLAAVLTRAGNLSVTQRQREDLAALIHLCGGGPATAYARRRFQMTANERCGDHLAASYLSKVNAMKRRFQELATRQGS